MIFEKLVNVVLPRIRDFRGIKNNSFDKSGNYTLGFAELSIFPRLIWEEWMQVLSVKDLK